MQTVTAPDSDRAASVAGLTLTDLPYPKVSNNDVVAPHAAGFTSRDLVDHTFINLDTEKLDDVGQVDVVFDVNDREGKATKKCS